MTAIVRPNLSRLTGPARWLLPPLALGLCLWLMAGRLDRAALQDMAAALAAIAPVSIGLALLFTAISFVAVGGFELTLRRMLGLGGPPARALRGGIAAVAVAQLAGFGVVTATFARWRALPELGLARAGELSVAVSLAFMAALMVLGALTLSVAQGLWGLTLGLGALLVALLIRLGPGARIPGLTPARATRALLWTAADVLAGALVLAALIPATALPPVAVFLAAYAAALTAGFLSQSPGGLGAFELTLMALLPAVPVADLLAALLAYRLIYHVLPGLIGAALLLRPGPAPAPPPLRPATGAALDRALARAPHGDWALVHQGALVLSGGKSDSAWLVRPAGHFLVALGDPAGQLSPFALQKTANAGGRTPLLYRCGPRLAAIARRAGWRTLRIADEALIDPATWSPDSPACRTLRRKLRQADAAGLRIEVEPADLPLTQMATLAAGWAMRNGGEMGFSMGRFDPRLITRAVVVLGWHGDRLAGFITLNRGKNHWSLDLMRQDAGAPDGTMQALVTAAIQAARVAGVGTLSLAAVPHPPPGLPGPLRRALTRDGLRQFKAGFAPHWRPRYLAAPGPLSVLAGLAQVTWAIHRPGPLPPRTGPMTRLHIDLAQNRFASRVKPCQSPVRTLSGGPAFPLARPTERPPDDQCPVPPA